VKEVRSNKKIDANIQLEILQNILVQLKHVQDIVVQSNKTKPSPMRSSVSAFSTSSISSTIRNDSSSSLGPIQSSNSSKIIAASNVTRDKEKLTEKNLLSHDSSTTTTKNTATTTTTTSTTAATTAATVTPSTNVGGNNRNPVIGGAQTIKSSPVSLKQHLPRNTETMTSAELNEEFQGFDEDPDAIDDDFVETGGNADVADFGGF